MKLIAILLSLGLEHYLHIGTPLKRFSWFEKYFKLFNSILTGEENWRGAFGLIAMIAPLAIIVGVIYYATCGWLYGIVGLLINFAVLIYCLGPESITAQLDSYFKASASNNQEELAKFTASKTTEEISRDILDQFNRQTFAVIFWFIILGPVGAVIYRLSSLAQRYTEKHPEQYVNLTTASLFFIRVLNWAPVRVLALCFALGGSFVSSFTLFLKTLKRGISENLNVLYEIGKASLAKADYSQDPVEEHKDLLALTDRALIIGLVILALLTVVAWVS